MCKRLFALLPVQGTKVVAAALWWVMGKGIACRHSGCHFSLIIQVEAETLGSFFFSPGRLIKPQILCFRERCCNCVLEADVKKRGHALVH